MKIKTLELRNFRCFEDATFTFADQFNVLIGNNGTGKTAILEALGLGLNVYTRSFDIAMQSSDTFANLLPKDARRIREIKADNVTFRGEYPIVIECGSDIFGQPVTWRREKNDRIFPDGINGAQIDRIVAEMKTNVQKGANLTLPLIAYYGVDRPFTQAGQKETRDWLKPDSPLEGYTHCLKPSANEEKLIGWLKDQEAIVLQTGKPSSMLAAVKKAVADFLERWPKIRYDFVENTLLAISQDDQQTLPFYMLSDGERTMLAMVADMAHRAAILNPHLGTDILKETPGVVLIDELDLHLHPQWQRRVVDDLRRTFPEVQFIVTTHSPFIIQSLRVGELILLKTNGNGVTQGQTIQAVRPFYKESIEDIVEDYQLLHIPQHSRRRNEMIAAAKQYYRLLEQVNTTDPAEIETLKQRLDALVAPFSDDIAYYTFLEMERAAAGLEDQNT